MVPPLLHNSPQLATRYFNGLLAELPTTGFSFLPIQWLHRGCFGEPKYGRLKTHQQVTLTTGPISDLHSHKKEPNQPLASHVVIYSRLLFINIPAAEPIHLQ